MTNTDLTWIDAHELAGLIRKKEVSPVDAVDAALAQLEKVEPKINAFVTVTAEQAREQARQAEQTLMSADADSLPPLFGVPISIKDLSDTAGVRTTYGAKEFAENVPDSDSVTVARLKEAGSILIGKTTTPLFGLLGTTESELTGITNNPWNTEFIAGGSSGGAGASVAAGVGALAWGSDGGGSVRVPASVCGVVGLKASRGRIPVMNPWESAGTDGPLTRSVADSALLVQVTAGPYRLDPLSLPAPTTDYLRTALEPRSLQGVRIAYAPRPAGGLVAREVLDVVGAAVRQFEAAGAIVEEVELPLPDPVAYFLDFWGAGFKHLAEAMGVSLPHPAMRELQAKAGDADAYLRAATTTRGEITRVYAHIFDSYDFLVTPTLPVVPFRHPGDAGGNTDVDGVPVSMPSIDFHRFTESPSHAGLPAITVPAGFSAEGLPVGMQIIGDHLDDAGAISLAAAFEQIAPWSGHRPSLAI